jgi:membrane-bound lytic murein transglycosylase D
MNPNKLKYAFYIVTLVLGSVVLVQSYFIYDLYQAKNTKTSGNDTTQTGVTMAPENLKTLVLTPVPGKMDFCGEAVPLDDPEVFERMEFEWIAAQHRNTANWIILKRSTRYFPIIEPILKKNKVPDDFKYLAVAESNLANVISPSNAEGFWQFLGLTGDAYGLEISKTVDERYDVAKATEAACKYLLDAYSTFKNWTLAAASYNMGQGGLSDEMQVQKQDNYYKLRLNSETSKYLFRIITWKYIIGNPASIGMEWKPEMGQKMPATRTLKISTSINDLVEWSIAQGTDYRMLKYLNPWIRGGSLEVKGSKTYDLLLPAN